MSSSQYQTEIISLEELVSATHLYRRFKKLWDLREVEESMSKLDISRSKLGFGSFTLFLCSLLQFMENLSDRELEKALQENNSMKWFCGFSLTSNTPHYSVFSKFRKKLGTKRLSNIFDNLKSKLQSQGYMNEVFTFVDASHLISKSTLWEERDRAI